VNLTNSIKEQTNRGVQADLMIFIKVLWLWE